MRPVRGLVRAVRSSWAEGVTPRWLQLLGPILGLLYRGAVAVRNLLFDREVLAAQAAGVPVISIGNLAVGGTGKTPLSAWLVSMLCQKGRSVALLTRGYGLDEVELHRRWNRDATVVVGADRVAGARKAVAGGAGILVLDDGFQHRRLARDLDIVLVAAEHPWPVRLLPLGPYREPLSALHRADVVILTHRTASEDEVRAWRRHIETEVPAALLAVVEFRGNRWTAIDGGTRDVPQGDLLAVAGVAQPQAFRRMVEAATDRTVELLAFDDHHLYHNLDVERIRRVAGGRTVVTTEKDAVKLQKMRGLPKDVAVFCLQLEWIEGLQALQDRLRPLWEGKPA